MIKVGFFGTPDIASYTLEKLCEKFEIAFLVAPEDRECGRNRTVQYCAAKKTACCMNIPVLQPVSLKDPEFQKAIEAFNADIFVVVAYGKLIPERVFSLPRLGTINLHPSLLPAYRGAAPVQWAVINGETVSGITVQMINRELDAGDIVLQEKINISKDATSGDLYEEILPLGAELLIKAVELLASGKAKKIEQNHDDATYCGKINREIARINWTKEVETIHNLVRGLNPKPAAWTTFRNKNIKLWKTALFNEDPEYLPEPGEIFRFRKKRLLAGTGKGILEILEIQPENRKIMDGTEFINGHRINAGEKFE
ncbi:MAG: methionyl-tRNA formyltransferase [Spirochaetota bacterium]